MAVDAKTRGLQVLAELYPDSTVRAARETELGDAGLTALGNGVLRREDHSREMNELGSAKTAAAAAEAAAQALYESNKTWWDQKQTEIQELDRLRAAGKTGVVDPTLATKPEPKYITAEQLAETERGAVAFFNDLNTLSMRHFQQFGEVLDTQALLSDKRVQQIGILGVYNDKHKPQLDARAAKIAQDAEDKIRLDERTKVLAATASQHHPYPVRGNEPSTLDRFERPSDQAPVAKTVDDMANEYARLSAVRTGSPA